MQNKIYIIMEHSSMYSRCCISEHLLFDILLWLPVASLLRFKSVCKSWYTLIGSSIFISNHFDHNSGNDNLLGICFDTARVGYENFCLFSGTKYKMYTNFDCELPWRVFEKTRLAFSSYGIICLVHRRNKFYLWNPALKQLRSLLHTYQSFSFLGFGFNVESSDHKIVVTTFCNQDAYNTLVEVYSLRADSWRIIHKDFALPSRFYQSHTYHITKDGTCYWIAYPDRNDDTDGNVILSFDLNEEIYKTMQLPVEEVHHSAVIGFLGDKLTYLHNVDSCYYEIWVLHEYGVEESWNKAWKIGPTDIPGTDDLLYPSSFIFNEQFLLLNSEGFHKKSGLLRLYDLGTEENEYLELGQHDMFFKWYVTYTESLFPVKLVNDAH